MAIYDITFEQISLGYGAAITVVLFLIIVAASFLILIAAGPAAAADRAPSTTKPRRRPRPRRTSLRLDSAVVAGRPAERAADPEEDGRRRRIRLPSAVTKVGVRASA